MTRLQRSLDARIIKNTLESATPSLINNFVRVETEKSNFEICCRGGVEGGDQSPVTDTEGTEPLSREIIILSLGKRIIMTVS